MSTKHFSKVVNTMVYSFLSYRHEKKNTAHLYILWCMGMFGWCVLCGCRTEPQSNPQSGFSQTSLWDAGASPDEPERTRTWAIPSTQDTLAAEWQGALRVEKPSVIPGNILTKSCFLENQTALWCLSSSNHDLWYRVFQADPQWLLTQVAVSVSGKSIALLGERRDGPQESVVFRAVDPSYRFITIRVFREGSRPVKLFFQAETLFGIGEGVLFQESGRGMDGGMDTTAIALYAAQRVWMVESEQGTTVMVQKTGSQQIWSAKPASLREWSLWQDSGAVRVEDMAAHHTALAVLFSQGGTHTVYWQCRFTGTSPLAKSESQDGSLSGDVWHKQTLSQRPWQMLWVETATGQRRLLLLYPNRIEAMSYAGKSIALQLPATPMSEFQEMGSMPTTDRLWVRTSQGIWGVHVQEQRLLSCPF